jgi:hypothetical protein
MFHATIISTADNAASEYAAPRGGQQYDQQQHRRVHHSGNRAFPAAFDVRGRPRDGPRGRNASEQGGGDVRHALRHQFAIGFVAAARHPSTTTADNNDSSAARNAIVSAAGNNGGQIKA